MSSKSNAVVRRLGGGVSWREVRDSGQSYTNSHTNGFQPHKPSFERDELAELLYTSLRRERGVDVEALDLPVTAAHVVRNLDNIKGSGFRLGDETYFFQHGKVIRRGLADTVVQDLIGEAATVAASGDVDLEAWEDAVSGLRAAQFLADFLGRAGDKEKSGKPIFLKSDCVAAYLALTLMFEIAVEKKTAVEKIGVPGSNMEHAIALSPDQIMEAISPEKVLDEDTTVEITAFGGAAVVEYHVPEPGGIFMALVRFKDEVVKQMEYYRSGQAGVGFDQELAEENMKFCAAETLIKALRGLQGETERLAKETGRPIPGHTNGNGGNGKPKEGKLNAEVKAETEPALVPVPEVVELAHGPESDDPDQQAEDERRAEEIDADLRTTVKEVNRTNEAIAEQMAITAEVAAADPDRVTVAGAARDSEAPPQAPRLKRRRKLAAATE